RAVPPSLILRRDVDESGWRARRPWAAALPILAGLAALAVWQAGSLRLGGIFAGAALAALAVLLGLSRALVRLARRLPRARGLAWRQGLAGLDRPGGHTARVVVAVGLGVMLLVAIALLEANLGRQLAYEQKREAPSFFFIDVQPDQREPFTRLVGEVSGVVPVVTPVVRARLTALDGTPVAREVIDRRKGEAAEKDWSLDGAPTIYLATARVPPDVETALQDRVVAAFPNVTAIPLRGVLERVSEVLAQIAFAVRFMALFSIAAGLVVMAGALAATRYQRLYESVILKTLGATRWAIARAFAVEYACLGAAAGVGGTALAAVLAWIVLRFVLDTPWTL